MWFPPQKDNAMEILCFLGCKPEQADDDIGDLSVIYDALTVLWDAILIVSRI